ncbi:MAG: DUF1223 domain-containing protein [Myxococcales bacterium]|nr:DUF1223 domain-containing protein [Myxococcales bacterium]
MLRLFAPLALLAACAPAEGTPRGSGPAGPLVLELFTSQGCSSCPPADRLLDKLAATGIDGTELAPLSFHVDYWDDLGWPDPYASPAWTERQRQYAVALNDKSVYTPELVVGGRAGMVGSNAVAISAAIARAERPALLSATAAWRERTVVVTAVAPADADVLVAVWEDGTKTAVPRGENAGETLRGDRVVRRLERVAKAGERGTLTVALAPGWKIGGAVAFAQRPDKAIVASALLRRD